MLLRHSALYGLARGVPGIINFLAISVYTRLLTPDTYGLYALVIAGVGLLESVLFNWLRLGLLRFYPAHIGRLQALLSTLFIGFLVMVVLTTTLGGFGYFLLTDNAWRELIPLAIVLLWAQAWFELNLELVRSNLAPLRYGAMSMFKAVLALVMGALLILRGFGASGPLLGLLAGTFFSAVALAWREWRGMRIGEFDTQLFVSLLRYGLPLTATFALTFLVSSSDRFLLAWYLGTDAAGLYAPGYDLAQYSLGMLMMIVNLAAYPLAVRALEQHGEDAARQQLRKNGLLLLTIAVPAATGIVMCAANIANVVLGEEFREMATVLMPWIALAALIAGFKAYFMDLSFQLGRNTMGQVWVMLVAGVVNLLLNLLWIPTLGLLGAAYATVIAYIIGFGFSWFLGRRVFRLPALPVETLKIILASAIMAAVLWPTLAYRGGVALLGQIVLGGEVYAISVLVFNLAGSRQMFSRIFLRT